MQRERVLHGVLALSLALSACATDPKRTVLNLDTTDPRWTSPGCVAARKQVADFNDQHGLRTVVSVAGNVLVPFAGTGASLALTGRQQREREGLNDRVLKACVSNHRKALQEAQHNRHRVLAAFGS